MCRAIPLLLLWAFVGCSTAKFTFIFTSNLYCFKLLIFSGLLYLALLYLALLYLALLYLALLYLALLYLALLYLALSLCCLTFLVISRNQFVIYAFSFSNSISNLGSDNVTVLHLYGSNIILASTRRGSDSIGRCISSFLISSD